MVGSMAALNGPRGVSMLDKMLEVGSAFDWISPLAAALGDIANVHSHKG